VLLHPRVQGALHREVEEAELVPLLEEVDHRWLLLLTAEETTTTDLVLLLAEALLQAEVRVFPAVDQVLSPLLEDQEVPVPEVQALYLQAEALQEAPLPALAEVLLPVLVAHHPEEVPVALEVLDPEDQQEEWLPLLTCPCLA
jgi:hypothetical protein